ncbi:TPA: hypothetical protein ACF37V_004715 [Vibrio parahaemolyticus]|uniref:hypothetical protein n=1 Tax=Vibrio parahaemolyticus TaxID=670 RepID=UPI001123FC33|nr:hypothetical protein CGI59_24045 [Vibrio parahaemolyticus]TOO76656.1 hypothetical protein CGH28_24090 [Vibrio parahaemolyticus]HAV1390489.1 hypothetical protein [Vibrio parahaemolyticus]
MYLYRIITELGETVDFYLSTTRNTKAAKTKERRSKLPGNSTLTNQIYAQSNRI